MKTFHAKRLIKLANFLTELPKEKFYFGTFSEVRECGTVACALGWAGMMPCFRKLGLKTIPENNEVTFPFNNEDKLEEGERTGFMELRAAREVFGLTESEADGLFLPGDQDLIGCRILTEKAKASSVVKNIVRVVKNNGFAVVEKNGTYEIKDK